MLRCNGSAQARFREIASRHRPPEGHPRHVKPAIMRRLEVPLDLRLDLLHLVLQAVLGWTDSHLWER